MRTEINYRRVEQHQFHVYQWQSTQDASHYGTVDNGARHAPTLIYAENDPPWQTSLDARKEKHLLNNNLLTFDIEVLEIFPDCSAPVEVLGHLQIRMLKSVPAS